MNRITPYTLADFRAWDAIQATRIERLPAIPRRGDNFEVVDLNADCDLSQAVFPQSMRYERRCETPDAERRRCPRCGLVLDFEPCPYCAWPKPEGEPARWQVMALLLGCSATYAALTAAIVAAVK